MFVLRKIWRALFSWKTRFEIHPFASLPTKYGSCLNIVRYSISSKFFLFSCSITHFSERSAKVIDTSKVSTGETFNKIVNSDLYVKPSWQYLKSENYCKSQWRGTFFKQKSCTNTHIHTCIYTHTSRLIQWNSCISSNALNIYVITT